MKKISLFLSAIFIFGLSLTAHTQECITADQAWNRIGETVCVEYYVANPHQSDKGNVFLNEKKEYKKGFTTVIFATARARFSADPVKEYGYKTIRVTGKIKMYEGHPEIIAEGPGQIVVKQ